MTHAGRMFRACNTNVSLTKILDLLREPCAIHTQFMSNSVQILRNDPRNFSRAQPHIRPVSAFVCLCAGVRGLLAICV
jgi:hypothetical protein